MKATGILLFAILIIGVNVHAQKIYIRGGLGAAVSTAASYYSDYTINTGTSNSYTTTSKKDGVGTGLPFVIATGFNLSEHFSVELGVDYFYGFTSKQNFLTYTGSSSDAKWHGQMLSLVPALVMSFPLEKFKPYARLGCKVGILNGYVVSQHSEYDYPLEKSTSIFVVDSKSKVYGGVAIGAQAAVGTDFALSDLISLFGEVQLDGISYAPTHGKYIEYTENGVDKLGSRTVNDNEWKYLREVDHSKTIPSDQPKEYDKVNIQFGNVGLLLGVKINL